VNVVLTGDDLANDLTQATAVFREHPVIIMKYIDLMAGPSSSPQPLSHPCR
jgi:hypothetical protein